MSSGPRRLNLAILAEVFNPEWPSLPVVAFKYVTALAKIADVTVFTQIRNRTNISKLGALDFNIEYIDNEYIEKPMYHLAARFRGGYEVGWTIGVAFSYLPYIEFERRAVHLIERQSTRFDVVHRVTPMTPTLPSYTSGRCRAPFVIGPLNGNLPWPKEFIAEQKREREMLEKVKSIYRYLPFYRSTYRNASAIIGAFPHTLRSIDRRFTDKLFDMPEIGYDDQIFFSDVKTRRDRVIFLYVGRLVPYKLPEIAILTFAERQDLRKHRLLIVGKGPEEERLRQLVARHGLEDCVEFLGGMAQREVATVMRQADIFFFPSIRELGAGVVIEAQACGLPCLVVDYGAPGRLVDETRGRKVRLGDKRQMTKDFAAAAIDLANNPDLIGAMSKASQEYARSFTWDRKARATMQIYEWALHPEAPKPVFQYK